MTADLVDYYRQRIGKVELDDRVFGRPVNEGVLHEVVVMQRACMRQGTAATRTRGMVSGSGRKPWKQKKTGRARIGSIRSPIWRHGGIVFGPQPRSYGYSVPKRKYHVALRSALSGKLQNGSLLITEGVELQEGKTKVLVKTLKGLRPFRRVLLVIGDDHAAVCRAASNLPDVTLLRPEGLNVYDLLRHDLVVIPQQHIAKIQEFWAPGRDGNEQSE